MYCDMVASVAPKRVMASLSSFSDLNVGGMPGWFLTMYSSISQNVWGNCWGAAAEEPPSWAVVLDGRAEDEDGVGDCNVYVESRVSDVQEFVLTKDIEKTTGWESLVKLNATASSLGLRLNRYTTSPPGTCHQRRRRRGEVLTKVMYHKLPHSHRMS